MRGHLPAVVAVVVAVVQRARKGERREIRKECPTKRRQECTVGVEEKEEEKERGEKTIGSGVEKISYPIIDFGSYIHTQTSQRAQCGKKRMKTRK